MYKFSNSLPMTNGLLNLFMLFGLLSGISLFFETSINNVMYSITVIMMVAALSLYLFLIVQAPKGTKRNQYIKKLIVAALLFFLVFILANKFNDFCSVNINSIVCGGF